VPLQTLSNTNFDWSYPNTELPERKDPDLKKITPNPQHFSQAGKTIMGKKNISNFGGFYSQLT